MNTDTHTHTHTHTHTQNAHFLPKQPLRVQPMQYNKHVRGPLINTHRGNTLSCSFHPFYPLIASGGSEGVVNLYAARM